MSSAPPAEPAPATAPVPPVRRAAFPWQWAVALAVGCGVIYLTVEGVAGSSEPEPPADPQDKAQLKVPHPGGFDPAAFRRDEKDKKDEKKEEKKKVAAPELEGGIAWLNTGGPLTLKKDLKGKVVILDFWTLCCINCIHVLPDFAKLEKKYANELVVIGVHSAKFDNEKDTDSIRKAILRYEIEHPVVNDADHKIWDKYEVDAWPTVVVIDPEGNLVGYTSGEGNYELLDVVVGKLVEEHKKKKTLDETPIRFDLAKYRESGDTPLFFPGKVLADEKGKRLFIADSTHHRIVVTDLQGNKTCVIGTGTPGKADGAFDKAQFNDPQGHGGARRHAVRGRPQEPPHPRNRPEGENRHHDRGHRRTGARAGEPPHGARGSREGDRAEQPVGRDARRRQAVHRDGRAPPDLAARPEGEEHRAVRGQRPRDDRRRRAAAGDVRAAEWLGKRRQVPVRRGQRNQRAAEGVAGPAEGKVETLVGRGLFVFGDRDGFGQDGGEDSGTEARMQHALGVTHHDGKLYVADTYNSKIKVYDIRERTLKTLVGGNPLGWFGPTTFSEPGGISYAGGKLYVADTNAHRIRVVDVATKAVTTLHLKGVEPPPAPKEETPKAPKK